MPAHPKTQTPVDVEMVKIEELKKVVDAFVNEFENAESYEEEFEVIDKYFDVFNELVALYMKKCVEKSKVADEIYKLIKTVEDAIFYRHLDFFRYRNDDYLMCASRVLDSMYYSDPEWLDLNQGFLFTAHEFIKREELDEFIECVEDLVYFDCMVREFYKD